MILDVKHCFYTILTFVFHSWSCNQYKGFRDFRMSRSEPALAAQVFAPIVIGEQLGFCKSWMVSMVLKWWNVWLSRLRRTWNWSSWRWSQRAIFVLDHRAYSVNVNHSWNRTVVCKRLNSLYYLTLVRHQCWCSNWSRIAFFLEFSIESGFERPWSFMNSFTDHSSIFLAFLLRGNYLTRLRRSLNHSIYSPCMTPPSITKSWVGYGGVAYENR